MVFHNKKIGLLMGGRSSEREVSLKTGEAILEVLKQRGYQVCPIDAEGDLVAKLVKEKIEVAFIALHGKYGEDGSIQGMLEIMGIPYTGSGILASALAMNKIASRKIFQHHKLPVPDYRTLKRNDLLDTFSFSDYGFPLVVKPAKEGSSVGISIVKEEPRLKEALDLAFQYDEKIVIERYIGGRDIQVGILNDRPLGAIEILTREEFYDYKAKYAPGLSKHVFPAPLPEEKYDEALELGIKAHRVLGCEGATRVDLIMDVKNFFHILEVNTLPGMTATSLLPEIAQGVNINFSDLVEEILKGARLKA